MAEEALCPSCRNEYKAHYDKHSWDHCPHLQDARIQALEARIERLETNFNHEMPLLEVEDDLVFTDIFEREVK